MSETDTTPAMTRGARIQRVQTDHNLTLSAMADRCGISKGAREKYINGTVKPGYDAIVPICTSFQIDPSWLLFGRGHSYTPSPADVQRLTYRVGEDHIVPYITAIAAQDNRDERLKTAAHVARYLPHVLSFSLGRVYSIEFLGGSGLGELHPILPKRS